jgi:hypothetical protein
VGQKNKQQWRAGREAMAFRAQPGGGKPPGTEPAAEKLLASGEERGSGGGSSTQYMAETLVRGT